MNSITRLIQRFFHPSQGTSLANTLDFEASFEAKLRDFIQDLPDAYGTGSRGKKVFDSMTTENELIFLRHYSEFFYTGRGKIVDLGCWLGATSASLAEGLSGRRFSNRQSLVEVYDLFEWSEWMNPIKEAIGAKVDFGNGECFLSHVQKGLARYGGLVSLHKVDLACYAPPDDWRIEFLFIDAMKSWKLAKSIASNFFPKLISGESLVVQQDFVYHHPLMSTNHLLMWHLREFFEPIHHVSESTSMVFYTKKTPSLSDIPEYSLHYFDEMEVAEAYRYCLPLVHESMRPSLLVAKLCHGLICQQKMTIATAVEELQGHQLSQEMQTSIVQSLREGFLKAPPSWAA